MPASLKTGYLFLFLLSMSFQLTAQVIFFVSPEGNDSNNGSYDKPFKTLAHAVDVASKIKAKGVTVYLRKGVYYIEKTIGIESTGFGATSLHVTAYRDEAVTISAGKRLELKWSLWKDGIYKTNVPAGISFERLYVNNQLQVLARYPNYDSAARVFHGTVEDAIAPGRIKKWKDPAGGYIHALHAYEWGGFHYRISGTDREGNLTMEGGWQNNRPNDMHKKYRFVENIFEELDAPGEWWLDKKEGVLYYYPPRGLNLTAATVEVSQLKNTIELKGTQATPLKNIQITGLRFAHNERSFMDTREPLLRSDWTIYRGGVPSSKRTPPR